MLAFRSAFSRFFSHDGMFLGAGLAFFVLVTLIPLTLLGVSILGFVLSSDVAANAVVDQLARNFPVYRREIRAALLHIVQTRALTGLIGTIVLVVFSTPLFGAARLILHRLLAIRIPPRFFRNLFVDSAMVILFGMLLFMATIVTWVYHVVQLFVLQQTGTSRLLVTLANIGLSLGLGLAMFYLAYRFVPRRFVRPRAALGGAIVASLLWEVAKQLFSLYIRNIGIYDQIYGPLGVLVAFVMFVYYSALVFVFGGAYTAALDSRRR
jgi:membrane protein